MVLSYLKYLFNSKTLFSIHSPFIYSFLSNVLSDETSTGVFNKIEKIRKELLKDTSLVKYNDLGAGKRDGLKEVGRIAAGSAVPARYGRLLFRIVRFFMPENMIELGTSLGISAMYQFAATKSSRMITVEGCMDLSLIAERNFLTLGFSNIELMISDFDDAVVNIFECVPKADYVFIDGNHTEEATIRYFRLFLEKHHEHSVFIFDDIHWSKDMERAWDYIRSHPDVKVTVDLFRFGIVLFRKELSRQNFIIRF